MKRSGPIQRKTPHELYSVWQHMIGRCTNPNGGRSWANYGGRGIRVCERWRDSFEEFLSDMGPRPSSGHSIDRIDNDGNYEPGNCRWATLAEQARNRRGNLRITHNGETLCVRDWSVRTGIGETTLAYRLKAGMPTDRIFYLGVLPPCPPKAAGTCAKCSSPPRPGLNLCHGCAEKQRIRAKAWRARAAAAGLCQCCGLRAATPGIVRCAPCQQKQEARRARQATG